MITFIGEPIGAGPTDGDSRSSVATAFPLARTIVTLPGIHATQRLAYTDAQNQRRQRDGQPPLTEQEQFEQWEQSVDLFVEKQTVLIRPDPQNMPLAFQADEMLQELVPKRNIKFMHALDKSVHDAIKRRGECWRISPVPRAPGKMREMIASSRIGIGGRDIYYYNKVTGTRSGIPPRRTANNRSRPFMVASLSVNGDLGPI